VTRVNGPGSFAAIEAARRARRVLRCDGCQRTFDPDPFNDLPLRQRWCWDCGSRERLRYVTKAPRIPTVSYRGKP